MATNNFDGIAQNVRLLTRATALLYVSLAVIILVAGFLRAKDLEGHTRHNTQARYALCALKSDLGRRIQITERFLRDHPQGIPGVSRADLQVSLNNQKSTFSTISPYLQDCPRGGEQ